MFNSLFTKKGLPEPIAIIILTSAGIVLVMAFFNYVYSNYNFEQDVSFIQRIIEKEKINSVVRLVGALGNDYETSYVLLFKKLDGSKYMYISVFNGTQYVNCSKVITHISGGRLKNVYSHRIEDIMVVSSGNIYSLRYYARAFKYPDTGRIVVCALELDRNTIAEISPQFLTPVASGDSKTIIESNNRRWRMYGSIEFQVAYLGNPTGNHLFLNNSRVQLRVGDVIRIDINTTVGKIDLTPQILPNGRLGAWVLTFNVFARTVYLNNALLARNVRIQITSDVAIDIDSLESSIYIEILPTPPGFVRVVHGGRTLVDYWNNSDYIRVVGWKIDASTQMVLQLDQTNMYAGGIARAVYIGKEPKDIEKFSLFVIAYVNNLPYLVDVYEYNLR